MSGADPDQGAWATSYRVLRISYYWIGGNPHYIVAVTSIEDGGEWSALLQGCVGSPRDPSFLNDDVETMRVDLRSAVVKTARAAAEDGWQVLKHKIAETGVQSLAMERE